MTCKNCSAEMHSRFCPDCGQKSDTHRISVGHVLHEGFHSVTHTDKGFLLLIVALLTKPGIVAREYLEGKRKKYFNPVTFLVVTSALFYFVSSLTGYMDALSGGNRSVSGEAMPAFVRDAFYIATHSGKWLLLLLIVPLMALISWLLFIRRGYNYAEHFVLNSFIAGQAALFRLIVMIPLAYVIPLSIGFQNYLIFEPIYLFYLGLAYYQFFKEHAGWIVVKTVLTRLLFLVLFWALIFLFAFIKHSIFA
jgi:hypothetical protein